MKQTFTLIGILILAIIGVIFISGCTQQEERSDWNWTITAIQEKNSSICGRIENTTGKDVCYNSVAMSLKDSSLCEKISKSYSKDNCYRLVAVTINNSSLCININDSEQKNICYFIAIQLNNSGTTENQNVTSYISCGCGCCGFDKPLEEVAKVECLYKSKGESIQDKINQDKQLSPYLCATVGCSFPIKYVYCD